MGAELTLSYAGVEELERDFESNLRKGRAFVPGASGLAEREFCTVLIEHPNGSDAWSVRAEAVWISAVPGSAGVGVQFVDFDAQAQGTLTAFVSAGSGPSSSAATVRPADSSDELAAIDGAEDGALSSSSSGARNLHDRVRDLSLSEREAMARTASLPERVALERRYGSSVWEGLLHNPQLTPREVTRMAKSTSLPTTLVNLIVANKGWLADSSIQAALLQNPRVSGAHLDRVLRALPQSELIRISEQNSQRMQVRTGAKRLIRR